LLPNITKFYARARDPEKPPVLCNIAADQQAVRLIFSKTQQKFISITIQKKSLMIILIVNNKQQLDSSNKKERE
jgi:hypothetical protein